MPQRDPYRIGRGIRALAALPKPTVALASPADDGSSVAGLQSIVWNDTDAVSEAQVDDDRASADQQGDTIQRA